jgi:metacaspase-1
MVDTISDPMNDRNAPEHYLDNPPEGFVRVHFNAEDFVDLPADDANTMYIDNNIVNFAIQPLPVTLEIDSQPLTLYYQSGAELRLPTLSTITDDYNDGTYLTYIAGTQLVRCDRNFQPMYNAFTTPRLHWLKVALHDKVRELAAQQLEMAQIIAAFADILALYSELDGTASWTETSSRSRLKEVTMAQGFSLHIGLNGVDASKYNGWPGTLAGCVNDANAMQTICSSQGFTTQMLLNSDATADAILGAIGQAAFNLQSGDTFVISYSGHGGQVPDTTGSSPNGLDDTWVAYDRMVLGHELYNLWGQFAAGVRIEVYSDSCHSGTVIRDMFVPSGGLRWPTSKRKAIPLFRSNVGASKFGTVFGPAFKAASKDAPNPTYPAGARVIPTRAIPPAIALALFERDQAMYETAQWTRKRGDITASVILISGCQDNQESQDGQNNGLFTEKLLTIWDNGNFSGTLPQFHQGIVALMPSTQTPNYFTVGVDDDVFTNSRPLTIVAADQKATVGTGQPAQPAAGRVRPQVTGPAIYGSAQDVAPSFHVTLGSNPYYIFEATSDPACFGNPDRRTSDNFYASWNDPQAPARYTTADYSLPSYAWKTLRNNSKLYYRVGSTSSAAPNRWDDYLVSTTDGDAASAPSVILTGAPGVAYQPPLATTTH